jgi:hypothetical protein
MMGGLADGGNGYVTSVLRLRRCEGPSGRLDPLDSGRGIAGITRLPEDSMRRAHLLVLILAGGSLWFPDRVLAQEGSVVAGQRVRVTSFGVWKGVVQRSSPDSVLVALEGGGLKGFAVPDIGRVDVIDGRHSRGRGALIGLGVGGAAGLIAGALMKSDDCGVTPDKDLLGLGAGICDSVGSAALVMLPVAGILVGSGIGALLGGGERWRTVFGSTTRVVSITTRGRATLGLTIAR